MKKLSYIQKNLSFLLIILCSLIIYSCEDDPCEGILCQHQGTCISGICDCQDWYEGESCEDEMREKFYGNYFGTLTGGGETLNSTLLLEPYAANIQRIRMDSENYIEISGTSTFELPLQNVYDDGFTYSIEGNGSLNGSQIILNFAATVGGESVAFTFNGSK